ncbi:unnamed protein product [Pedinophyceae sp. YPF-701]|nr:unnamed protein product [Pedinophyceae sp. YPF-701]CAG9465363.1 unnamed protein product [Pedinophyceae sp. YPF-701]
MWHRAPGLPDNAVSDTFLDSLVIGSYETQRREYWSVVLAATAVTQQVAAVAAVAVASVLLYHGRVATSTVVTASLLVLAAGWSFCCFSAGRVLGGSLLRVGRQTTLLYVGVRGMSPLLASLTATISSDTVLAVSVTLAVAHLYLHDYNFTAAASRNLSGTLSLSAAIGASVLVSSRLPTPECVFAHLIFCLVVFLLTPYIRHFVRARSISMHVALTVALVAAPLPPLAAQSSAAAVALVVVHLFILFACPLLFLHAQQFKLVVQGRWDEAPTDARAG